VPVKRTRKRRRAHRHRRSACIRMGFDSPSETAPKGVVADAKYALSVSKIRNYSVPIWVCNHLGVHPSVLRTPLDKLSVEKQEQSLYVRLFYLTNKLSGDLRGLLLAAIRLSKFSLLGDPRFEYSVEPLGSYSRVNFLAGMGRLVHKFVHLCLPTSRSERSPGGPGCVSCSHVTCGLTYWIERRTGSPSKVETRRLGLPRVLIPFGR